MEISSEHILFYRSICLQWVGNFKKREREKSRGKGGRKEEMEGERVKVCLLLWFLSHCFKEVFWIQKCTWIVITRRLFGSDKSNAIVILVNKYFDMLNMCGFKIVFA